MRCRSNQVAAGALIIMIVTVVISIVTLELATRSLSAPVADPAHVSEQRMAEHVADEQHRARRFVHASEIVLVACSLIGLVFGIVMVVRSPSEDAPVTMESSLLDDLLDAVRVGDGDATLVRADWDVDVLIAETVDGLGATAADRGISLRAVPSGLGSVYADRKRVQRALAVLTSQALELGKLGCEIVVRARLGESCVRFEVSAPDGSHAAPSGHAFEIMRCTCKRLVEAHHGTLGLDQLGGRQTFWFTLLTEPACLT